MSQVYNPQSDVIAEIEQLEREARAVRQRIEHAAHPQDRRSLNRQLEEIRTQIEYLRRWVP